MRIEKIEEKKVEEKIIVIQENVRVPGTNIILEIGDKVKIIEKENE